MSNEKKTGIQPRKVKQEEIEEVRDAGLIIPEEERGNFENKIEVTDGNIGAVDPHRGEGGSFYIDEITGERKRRSE